MSMSTVSARRLAAASVAAAAVLGAVALPASAADHSRPERTRVEISSVQYNSPGRDDQSNRSLNKEWVELTNTTRDSVNLDGWRLSAEDGRTYTFDDYRLAARATVRIHTGEGRDTRTDLFQDRRHYVWDNHSDTATLRNGYGRVIDEASWGNDRSDGDNGDRYDGGRYDGDRRHGYDGDRYDGDRRRGDHGDRYDGDRRRGHHGDRHHGGRGDHGRHQY